MERKNQKQKFQELLRKMDALQETEKGKLKGEGLVMFISHFIS